MGETATQFLELVAKAVEYAGVGLILIGIAISSAIFLWQGFHDREWGDGYKRFRANLGRGILLGLELLVAADIIATVTAPLTLESVGLLGLIVLIRTFLSFALETEIEGRWPWRRAEGRPDPKR